LRPGDCGTKNHVTEAAAMKGQALHDSRQHPDYYLPMEDEMQYGLFVLWRTEGEQLLQFATRSEAQKHMHTLDELMGHKIVKMEVTKIEE
jgi:hypothetical protein